jgi:hypothetical protein
MKQILLLILIIVSFRCYSQDTIYWSPCYQLKYEDFQGTPDTTKIDLANSYIQIDYTYNVVNNQLQFKVNCFFLKKISWTKYNMATLMEHEQGHFDIGKLFALKLEQRFKAYKITNTVQQDLKAIYDTTIKELYAMADLFDAKIKGAKNDTPQKEFMAAIKKQIPGCKK